jgi:hydroxymethylpyrimidine pyrophosphatase-like HAD family hydrolase
MLEYAGMPVVMANASEELKQLGWTVTLSNDEGGVAAAVEQALGLQTANT